VSRLGLRQHDASRWAHAASPVVGLAVAALLAPVVASGCTVFSLPAEGGGVVAATLDWDTCFPGDVVVNPRGIEKSILPWHDAGPAPYDGAPVVWRSRYASVTLTCYGRDFIEGGVNEAGLVVEQASLGAVYPPEDARPGVSCAQWMQYQLDRFASVEEVLDHLGDLRPDGEGWHYLVCDREGEVAVIEYPDGAADATTGADLPWPIITNTSYRKGLETLTLDLAFGGTIDVGASSDSYGRFVRVARAVRARGGPTGCSTMDDAVAVLETARVSDTCRWVVYDQARARLVWATRETPAWRWVDLDGREGNGPLTIDVDTPGTGCMNDELRPYSERRNREIARAVWDLTPGHSNAAASAIQASGSTCAPDRIARHPTAHSR